VEHSKELGCPREGIPQNIKEYYKLGRTNKINKDKG
jgi:hypothetical protein